MFYVYLLRSQSDESRTYVGFTEDPREALSRPKWLETRRRLSQPDLNLGWAKAYREAVAIN